MIEVLFLSEPKNHCRYSDLLYLTLINACCNVRQVNFLVKKNIMIHKIFNIYCHICV